MAKKNREPRDSQMDLARRADARRRYSEEGPSGMTFFGGADAYPVFGFKTYGGAGSPCF
jgi:hypothetical protein